MTGADIKKTDFNDLMITEGEDVVRAQIDAALAAGDVPAASPLPSVEAGRMTLDEALQRFSLAIPDAKVWDSSERKLIKQGAARAWWGKPVFEQWMASPERATVRQDEVVASAAAAQSQGSGDLANALARYTYLYPTADVWDVKTRAVVPINSLKIAIADVYEQWVKHPRRRQIDRELLVFKPGAPWEKDGQINTFRGLPIKPLNNMDACRNIRAMIWHLCNQNDEIFQWLIRWMALPLQKIGTKMASAVIMHSDVHGSGKSLLFDNVMTALYGEYGAVFGQTEMESQYTEWSSQKLYAVFEEITSRQEKYNNTGKVKHMITGKTHRIQKKFVSSWEEANYMNSSILSNEFMPHPIEPADRRMFVVWPEKKLPSELRWGVMREIEGDGVKAFYGWLLSIDLGDFHSHSEPPMTEAKQRLIDFGRQGWELFHRDWSDGQLDVPYTACLVNDLYQVYRSWCHDAGERTILSREKFSGFLSSKERRIRDVRYIMDGQGQSTVKGTFFQIGQPEPDQARDKWLGDCAAKFRKCMKQDVL